MIVPVFCEGSPWAQRNASNCERGPPGNYRRYLKKLEPALGKTGRGESPAAGRAAEPGNGSEPI